MNTFKSFRTDRLLLKPAELSDAGFVLTLLNSPKWLQFIGQRNVHTVEEARSYIRDRMIPQLQRVGYGNYMVIDKETGVTMGSSGLYQRPGLPVCDIGFAFLEPYEGKGYGFEAASRLLQAAKEDFNLKKVSAICSKNNAASIKLLGKLGLSFQHCVTLPGETEELNYYEIVLD